MISILRIRPRVSAQTVSLRPAAAAVWTRYDGVVKRPGSRSSIVVDGEIGPEPRTDWLFLEPGVLVVRVELLNEANGLTYCLCNDVETFGIQTAGGPLQAFHPFGRRAKGTRGPCSLVDSYYMPAFRIEGRSPFELFTTHGFAVHPEDDLKTICERHALTGLEFEEFWRGPLEDLV